MNLWRKLMVVVVLLATVIVGLSHIGTVFAPGDSLSVIRIPVIIIGLVALWMTGWSRSLRILLTGLGLWSGAVLAEGRIPPAEPGPVLVYQKNLLFKNTDVTAAFADITQHSPDIVTLQELSPGNADLLAMLSADYPFQHYCQFSSWAGVAVLSRHAVVANSEFCAAGKGLAGMRVRIGNTDVWVTSLHLHWPWPYGQFGHVTRLLPTLAALEGAVIVGGDFNMMPWGGSVARIKSATRTRRAGAVVPTITKKGLPLPIDHVLAPGGGTVTVLDKLGSDHAGVLTRVFLVPDTQ